jgi:hypothetical protein
MRATYLLLTFTDFFDAADEDDAVLDVVLFVSVFSSRAVVAGDTLEVVARDAELRDADRLGLFAAVLDAVAFAGTVVVVVVFFAVRLVAMDYIIN